MTLYRLMNVIVPGIIIPFGTLGNILAIWTIFKSHNLLKKDASIYLITIFIADLMTNLSNYFVQWIIFLTNANIPELYDSEKVTLHANSSNLVAIECSKYDPFFLSIVFGLIFATISFGTTTAFTIERVIVIFRRTWRQKKLSVLYTISIIIGRGTDFSYPTLRLSEKALFWMLNPNPASVPRSFAWAERWSWSKKQGLISEHLRIVRDWIEKNRPICLFYMSEKGIDFILAWFYHSAANNPLQFSKN